MSYNNVLIAVDTNDESYNILEKGEEIARNHNAKLFIIHIDMKFEDYYTGMMNFDFDKYNEKIREHSEKNYSLN
jgi:universal stress protein A